MSNLGRWDAWYNGLEADDPQPYGDTVTYQMLADWVTDCATVEDWGCGKGWMRQFIDTGRYTGVDGTASPFADVTVDLAVYQSDVDGIVMRHVIEHDPRWAKILTNLTHSFRQRCGIALFTPMCDGPTHEMAFTEGIGVPDISFNVDDILCFFDGCIVERHDLRTGTQYGVETVLLIERASQ